MISRSSGILMPLSSLPSPYGIGTLGRCAYDFIDFLSDAGQKYWQLLPLGPNDYVGSPYASLSTFAGSPYYIDLDMLIEGGLLTQAEVDAVSWGSDIERTDYDVLLENRPVVLRKAFSRGKDALAAEILAFREKNASWLEPYALYMAVKAHFHMAGWSAWPDEDIRMRKPEAVKKYSELLREDVDYYVFTQYLFYTQWDALRAYAREKGILFIGDVPIYVAMDSADVWHEPQFFQLDGELKPTYVAGVPPDAFNDDGQLWGNPLYDYEAMERDGFGWWIRRIYGAQRLYDAIRIDHFRGFETYWSVPADSSTAKDGKWIQGPGMKLVGVLTSWFYGMQFIAEDLGIITPAVRKLLDDSRLPGMKVLEFAFDANGESLYLPHNCTPNSVCYLGTHDNNTVLGWLDTEPAENIEFARQYINITPDEGWNWGLIRAGMATSSALFVTQMQDVLGLPASARMNFPGTTVGNWQWRMRPDAVTPEITEKLRRYTETFRRTAIRKPTENEGS